MAGPKPPTDVEVAEATGYEVETRALLRSSPLSTVERVALRRHGGLPLQAVIKTTRPILAHEARVNSLLDGFSIVAAALLGDARTLHGDPWMLLTEARGADVDDDDWPTALLALEGLAEVHLRYLGHSNELEGVPRWDPTWLAAEADRTCETLRRIGADDGLPLTDEMLGAYRGRLELTAEALRPIGVTLVHGDFDPGNLVCMSGNRVAALDWGLSHVSTPLVDLAHMVERFCEATRSRLSARYLGALGIETGVSEEAAVAAGGLAHRAFFIWWHTRVMEEGWGAPAEHGELIVQRVQSVVDWA